jgi:AcrR family transcriptional regulator
VLQPAGLSARPSRIYRAVARRFHRDRRRSLPRTGGVHRDVQKCEPIAIDAEPNSALCESLSNAVVSVVARRGVAATTVASILAGTSLSRAAFYTEFSGVCDCLATVQRLHMATLARRLERCGPDQVLDSMAQFALEDRVRARFVFAESLSGGRASRETRLAVIKALTRALWGDDATGAAEELAVGAVWRLFALTIVEGGDLAGALAGARRWLQLVVGTRSEAITDSVLHLATGDSVRGDDSRQRLVDAVFGVVVRHGCAGTTASRIATRAGVSRTIFYRHFAGRQAAIEAAYEQGFKEVTIATVPVFFRDGAWPDRVWEAVAALVAYCAHHPSRAFLGFVECFAIARSFDKRVYASQLAARLFVEDGARASESSSQAGDVGCSLAAFAALEALYRAGESGLPSAYWRMHGAITAITLATYVGHDEANAYLDARRSGAIASRKPAIAPPRTLRSA